MNYYFASQLFWDQSGQSLHLHHHATRRMQMQMPQAMHWSCLARSWAPPGSIKRNPEDFHVTDQEGKVGKPHPVWLDDSPLICGHASSTNQAGRGCEILCNQTEGHTLLQPGHTLMQTIVAPWHGSPHGVKSQCPVIQATMHCHEPQMLIMCCWCGFSKWTRRERLWTAQCSWQSWRCLRGLWMCQKMKGPMDQGGFSHSVLHWQRIHKQPGDTAGGGVLRPCQYKPNRVVG